MTFDNHQEEADQNLPLNPDPAQTLISYQNPVSVGEKAPTRKYRKYSSVSSAESGNVISHPHGITHPHPFSDWHARFWCMIDGIGWVAFLLFLAFLPVTSFPYFPPSIGGGALVRPLSVFPLFVIIALVILPRLFRERLPHSILALGVFVLTVMMSGLVSLLRGVNPAFDVSSEARVLRVLITLGMGCSMYLAVVLTPRTPKELDASMRALYAGFTVALAWGSLQAVYVLHFVKPYYRFLNELQSWVSSRRLITNRVSGMTYEPNWFAVQITMLLLPWLIASVLSGKSVFPWRWRNITVELFLLIWSVGILLFTYSRAGLLNLAILIFVSGISYLVMNRKRFSRTTADHQAWLKPGNSGSTGSPLPHLPHGSTLPPLLRAVVVILILGVFAGAFFFIGTRNEFFTRLWVYWQKPNASLDGYFEYLGFGARQIYGDTALNIFYSYPWMGVGPGNYALYFAEMLPYEPLARTPEVLRVITPEAGRDRLITAKNFFLRLLAETGIIGTAAFIGFFITIIGSMLSLIRSPDTSDRKYLSAKTWGVGSLLALVTFTFSTLSFDSFALPNMWVAFGFITAAYKVYVIHSTQ